MLTGLWAGYIDMNPYPGWLAEPSPLDHDCGQKEVKHYKSQALQMQSVCAHVFLRVFAYAGVSLLCSVKNASNFFSLSLSLCLCVCVCVCVCVCWCSPLCSCDPWDSGWAVTPLISPSRNTARKMSSEHSELCLHSLQVPSLLMCQVILNPAPLPLPSRGLRDEKNKKKIRRRRRTGGDKTRALNSAHRHTGTIVLSIIR